MAIGKWLASPPEGELTYAAGILDYVGTLAVALSQARVKRADGNLVERPASGTPCQTQSLGNCP